MKSLFFNAGDRRCIVTERELKAGVRLRRLDVSNGLILMELQVEEGASYPGATFENWDRMLLLPLVRQGRLSFEAGGETVLLRDAEGGMVPVGPGEVRIAPLMGPAEIIFILAADFYLERYRQERDDPLDRICRRLEKVRGLETMPAQPLDALGDYLLERIRQASRRTKLSRLATEHRVVELLLHRLDLQEWEDSDVSLSPEELRVTDRARELLMRRFADPPTIPELARGCGSNDFFLKRAFKRRFGMTIREFITQRRLETANRLLREGGCSVGEAARRVGFRHQGYFARLFFRRYGIYPKNLQ